MEFRKEDCIGFNSYNEYYILSDMYPCDIRYDGKLFYGVDHVYYYMLLEGHPEAQEKIARCGGVCANFDAKEVGERYRKLLDANAPQHKVSKLKECIRMKFTQNSHCRKFLLDTGNTILVEYAFWGDRFWGCELEDDVYVGENHTGRSIMEIRDELRSDKA